MGRGLFSGIVWGIVVTGLVLVVLALVGPVPNEPGEAPFPRLTERPDAPIPADPAVAMEASEVEASEPGTVAATDIELPPGSEFNRAPSERDPSLPVPEVEAPGAPAVRGPGAGPGIVEAPLPDTAPAAAPEPVTDGPDGLAPPSAAEAPPELAAEDPVPQTPGTPGPAALRTGTAVRPEASGTSDTVAPPKTGDAASGNDETSDRAPQATEMAEGAAEGATPLSEAPTQAVPAPAEQPAPKEARSTARMPTPKEVNPSAEAPSEEDILPGVVPPARDAAAATEPPAPDEAGAAPEMPELAADGSAEATPSDRADVPAETPAAEDRGQVAVTAPAESAPLPQILPEPSVDGAGPSEKDTAIPDLDEPTEDGTSARSPGSEIDPSGVRIGRLPTVGQSGAALPDGELETEEPGAEVARATPSPVPELGALARNAVAFRSETERPLFSVILIDAGPEGLAREALMTFSFPVTFAIDPTQPDAAEAIDAYQGAGYEVVALASGLPTGAAPSDLEVAFAAQSDLLARAVAVMDMEQGGFQDDRDLTAQVVGFAGETGHGLVTYDRGLNAAARLAEQAGVPSATVFRMLDAGRPNAPTVRRMLDRAVFKARQDGHVVLVGHSYPDTVTALYSWALEVEAEAVSLAPISAILRQP